MEGYEAGGVRGEDLRRGGRERVIMEQWELEIFKCGFSGGCGGG